VASVVLSLVVGPCAIVLMIDVMIRCSSHRYSEYPYPYPNPSCTQHHQLPMVAGCDPDPFMSAQVELSFVDGPSTCEPVAPGPGDFSFTDTPSVMEQTQPTTAKSAVLAESVTMPPESIECRGHDFNAQPRSVDELMASFLTTGFQATNLGLAIRQVEEMRKWRLSDVDRTESDREDALLNDEAIRKLIRARIFLAYTSNQISCGQREVIRFLVQHKMVDVLVTTAGGVEEDIIKCFHPTYMGDFKLSGRELRQKGTWEIDEWIYV
jgi:Deoxyhypusine synthase